MCYIYNIKTAWQNGKFPGEGGGGYSGFQDFKLQEWLNGGKNQTPKKIPGPKINPKEIPCQISRKH